MPMPPESAGFRNAVMTNLDQDLLDPFIVARSEIRAMFREAHVRVSTWEPRRCPTCGEEVDDDDDGCPDEY